MSTINVNFKSDFKIWEECETGYAVPFRFSYFTNSPSNAFEATFDGTDYENCTLLEDGRLCVSFDDHNLGLGVLKVERRYYLTDADYESGICDQVITAEPVVCVDDDGNEYYLQLSLNGVASIETTVVVPAYYQKGDPGFTEEEKEAIIEECEDAAEDARNAATSISQVESDVEAAEAARAIAENGRASAEQARQNSEALRVTAESERVSAENARATAETTRVGAENSRVSAETVRRSAETTRQNSEQARVTAEGTRENAEAARVTAENARISAEQARVTAEQGRVSAEQARVTAETARASAESARVSTFNANESSRQSTFESNESSRQSTFGSNESSRQSTFETNEAARDALVDEKVEDITNLQSEVATLGAEHDILGSAPTAMSVDAPEKLTYGNLVKNTIDVTMSPEGAKNNVIFQSDNEAVKVAPDGKITIKATGTSEVHVIPTLNTALYKTIQIEVVAPNTRFANTRTQFRMMGNGGIRLD